MTPPPERSTGTSCDDPGAGTVRVHARTHGRAGAAGKGAPNQALEFRTWPCDGERKCPWRTDADLTCFTDEDMARLDRAQGGVPGAGDSTDSEVHQVLGAPGMACHKDQADTAHPLRWCAGWLAVVGPDHIGVRMATITGKLPPEVVYPPARDQWPALYPSLHALQASRARQIAAAQVADGRASGGRADEAC